MPRPSNTPGDFITDLQTTKLDVMVSRWITDRIPDVFAEDNSEYIEWKRALAAGIGVDPRAILVVGSFCLGFSLNPSKKYRKFGRHSDIDVAAVSDFHFDVAWSWMRNIGAERHRLSEKAKASLQDHRTRLVYFGAIASDKILP